MVHHDSNAIKKKTNILFIICIFIQMFMERTDAFAINAWFIRSCLSFNYSDFSQKLALFIHFIILCMMYIVQYVHMWECACEKLTASYGQSYQKLELIHCDCTLPI